MAFLRMQLRSACQLPQGSARGAGFSMLELMVAMAVLLIGLAMVVPGMSQLVQSNKLSSTSNELQLAFTYARMEAIRQNRSVVFCHSLDGSLCSEAPDEGWQGWLIRAAGSSFGAETGSVLRTGILAGGALQIRSGSQLASSKDAVMFAATGQLLSYTSAQPLSDLLQLCMAQPGLSNNIRQLKFKSNGRISLLTQDGGGECE
jgi:type IV fimbrial biogenesis protein FimT